MTKTRKKNPKMILMIRQMSRLLFFLFPQALVTALSCPIFHFLYAYRHFPRNTF